eukprot:7611229-Alexandrium_andersonii.AAC.1
MVGRSPAGPQACKPQGAIQHGFALGILLVRAWVEIQGVENLAAWELGDEGRREKGFRISGRGAEC